MCVFFSNASWRWVVLLGHVQTNEDERCPLAEQVLQSGEQLSWE